jgi:hypothetical protein
MRSLAYWIGRHEWTSRVEQGERYKVCARCGKEPRRRRGAPGYGRGDPALTPGNEGASGDPGDA